MAVVNGKKIIGLSVETDSGRSLGKIVDFELEVNSQSILKYYVRGGSIFRELFINELIVHRGQVISIDDKRMIVEDSVIKEKEIKRVEVAATA